MGSLSLTRYPAEGLFLLLKQKYALLEKYEQRQETEGLRVLRKETNYQIAVIKNVLVDRFKDSNMSLRTIASKILTGKDYELDVYKSLFLTRVLSDRYEIIDTETIEKVIDVLEVDNLRRIIEEKKDTLYGSIADTKYQEMMFKVEKDVEAELEIKMLEDMKLSEEEDLLQEKREKASKFQHVESPYTEKDTITIQFYLNNYLALPVTDMELTHNDLKKFQNHCIVEVSNDFANLHPELVTKKYILLVLDKKKYRRSYVNPQYLDKILDITISRNELNAYCKHMRVDLERIKDYIDGYELILDEVRELEKIHSYLAPKLQKKKVLVKERDEINEKH